MAPQRYGRVSARGRACGGRRLLYENYWFCDCRRRCRGAYGDGVHVFRLFYCALWDVGASISSAPAVQSFVSITLSPVVPASAHDLAAAAQLIGEREPLIAPPAQQLQVPTTAQGQDSLAALDSGPVSGGSSRWAMTWTSMPSAPASWITRRRTGPPPTMCHQLPWTDPITI